MNQLRRLESTALTKCALISRIVIDQYIRQAILTKVWQDYYDAGAVIAAALAFHLRRALPLMNFKELVDVVSSETNLPAGEVRKVGMAVLKKFADLIDNQTNFVSPVITLTAVTSPAKPAAEGKPELPQRKFARMAVRAKKSTSPAEV